MTQTARTTKKINNYKEEAKQFKRDNSSNPI